MPNSRQFLSTANFSPHTADDDDTADDDTASKLPHM
jgi:hypothetical protein